MARSTTNVTLAALALLALAWASPALAQPAEPESGDEETEVTDREALPGDLGPWQPTPLERPVAPPDDPPPDDDDEPEDAPEPEPPPVERTAEEIARRERRHVLHNTWQGTVGGIRVADAGSGAAGAFRISFYSGFAHVPEWILPDDTLTQTAGQITVSWTPFDFLEIYAAASTYQNETRQLDSLNLVADTLTGFKLFHAVLPWLTVGGDLWLGFRADLRDIGQMWETTSVHVRANLSADLRELESGPLPLIFRFNAGYFLNQTAGTIANTEQARYDALPDEGEDARRPLGMEDRHLFSAYERFALQIDRVDRLTLAVGFEAPIDVPGMDLAFSPIVEYAIELPVNRQGFECPPPSETGPRLDRCLDDRGGTAFRQSLALGLRVRPILRGLSLSVVADVGLSGMRAPVHELAVQVPYRLLVGFAYAYDTTPDP